MVGDFERHLDTLPPAEGPRVVAFLGGTIGNFPPGTRRRFLRRVAAAAAARERPPAARHRPGQGPGACSRPPTTTPPGVTAAFNRNVLHVINRELDADFDLDAFEHVAFYDREHEWIEMRLRALRAAGRRGRARSASTCTSPTREELRTEISAKFTRERLEADLGRRRAATLVELMTDPDGLFALALARRSPG